MVDEIASYALIALMGAQLLYTKGGAFSPNGRCCARQRASALPRPRMRIIMIMGTIITATTTRIITTTTRITIMAPPRRCHGHDQAPHHVHDEHLRPFARPTPRLAGPGGWKRGLMAIFAVGLRPCSGAILVLVFALAQGIFWAGIAATLVMGLGTAITVAIIATLTVTATGLAARFAATRTGYGTLALRGIEVAAAVLLFVRRCAARRLYGERADGRDRLTS